jgi:hypothetical protein
MAQEVLRTHTKRGDKGEETKPRKMPEALLCRLLGLSGLGWDDQALLAPIWNKLFQQTDKTSKDLALRSFFQDLGQQVPAFRQFRNTQLFEHILSHKFEPGASYDTCHHGISLLAVSM